MLCTFKDADRYKRYHIIHCIKKGADKLKREDFLGKEEREDEYGTSVISIQILKTGGFISIKNRYNHTVKSSDNTFYSNPDRIIEGLTGALKGHFKVDFFAKKKVFIPSGYILVDDQILKYDKEVNNTYFGDGFYCRDGVIFPIDKNSQLQIDEFILDLKEKKILNPAEVNNPLIQVLSLEIEGETLQVQKKDGVVVLSSAKGEILTLKDRALKTITLRKVETLPENAFYQHPTIEEINALSVTLLLPMCVASCQNLKKIYFKKLRDFHSSAFDNTDCAVIAPSLSERGICFFNTIAFDLNEKEFLTRGIYTGEFLFLMESALAFGTVTYSQNETEFTAYNNNQPCFKFRNGKLVELTILTRDVKEGLIKGLPDLEILHAPEVVYFAHNNINNCPNLKKVYLYKTRSVGDNNISNCDQLEYVYAPVLEFMGNRCGTGNKNLKHFNLPELKEVKDNSCLSMSGYEEIYAPKLIRSGYGFCRENPFLIRVCFSSLKCAAEYSFSKLNAVEEILLNELQYIEGQNLITDNPNLKRVGLNKLMNLSRMMLKKCPLVEEIYANSLQTIESKAVLEMSFLRVFEAPHLSEKRSLVSKEKLLLMMQNNVQRLERE